MVIHFPSVKPWFISSATEERKLQWAEEEEEEGEKGRGYAQALRSLLGPGMILPVFLPCAANPWQQALDTLLIESGQEDQCQHWGSYTTEPGVVFTSTHEITVKANTTASEIKTHTQLIPQVCPSVPAPLPVTVSCLLLTEREDSGVTTQ